MRRLGKSVIVIIAIAIIAASLCVYVFLLIKKLPDTGEHNIVKTFSFLQNQDLNEWQEKRLMAGSTEYSATDYEGKPCIKAVSNSSASALFYKERLLHDKNPFLSWQWKAEEFPLRKRIESLSDKGEFDFAAQVYVIFYARFLLNSKAIQYVWAKDLPKGTSGDNPYTKKVKVLVLESGLQDEWKREDRNIREDFKLLFGQSLEKDVTAIAFMTDSDSTATNASAYYGDITIGYLKSGDFKGSIGTSWQNKLVNIYEEIKERYKGNIYEKKTADSISK